MQYKLIWLWFHHWSLLWLMIIIDINQVKWIAFMWSQWKLKHTILFNSLFLYVFLLTFLNLLLFFLKSIVVLILFFLFCGKYSFLIFLFVCFKTVPWNVLIFRQLSLLSCECQHHMFVYNNNNNNHNGNNDVDKIVQNHSFMFDFCNMMMGFCLFYIYVYPLLLITSVFPLMLMLKICMWCMIIRNTFKFVFVFLFIFSLNVLLNCWSLYNDTYLLWLFYSEKNFYFIVLFLLNWRWNRKKFSV